MILRASKETRAQLRPPTMTDRITEDATRGVAWLLIQRWGMRLATVAVFVVLARLLGPEALGLVAAANIVVVFVNMFIERGFATALIQREVLEDEHIDAAFWVSLGLGSALSIATALGADLIAAASREPELAPVVRWLALSFVIVAFSSVQAALQKRRLGFDVVAVCALAAAFTSGALGIGMALAGFGVWSLVARQLFFGVTYSGMLWWRSDWRPRRRFSRKHFHDILDFSLSIFGLNFVGFLKSKSSDLLILFFLGSVALGFYDTGFRFLLVLTQLMTGVMQQVALPTFSRLQREPDRLRAGFYAATQLSSLIAFPAFIGMAVLAPEIILVFFGEVWLPSVPVMRVLALIGLLHSLYYFNSSVIMALGKPHWQLRINTLDAVLNVIGFFIAVHWGIVAVAAAYVIRGYLVSPIPLWALNKLIGLDLRRYLAQIATPAGGTAIMAAAMLICKAALGQALGPAALLVACGTVAVIVYTGYVVITAPALAGRAMRFARMAARFGER